jgi:hypothetical protein
MFICIAGQQPSLGGTAFAISIGVTSAARTAIVRASENVVLLNIK